MRHCLLGLCLVLLFGACTPRTTVRQNPGPRDKGIRYYRPKPYLLLQPPPVKDDTGARQDKYVQVSLEYLPDFSEEYSINVHSGLGVNSTKLTLADGWNLTEINQELDSQFDENVGAIANLLKAAAPGGIVGTAGEQVRGPSMVVNATNVPLGYYESVISRGPDGKKQLYGWRYVGFYPFNACPLGVTGIDCVDCHSSLLYGLVFRNGIMTFEAMHNIAQRSAKSVKLVPATEARRLPLTEQVLATMAAEAKQAVTIQFRVPPDSFSVNVDESRPHIVFTLIAQDPQDADAIENLLNEHKDDITESLHRVIQESTREPYSPIVRVVGR